MYIVYISMHFGVCNHRELANKSRPECPRILTVASTCDYGPKFQQALGFKRKRCMNIHILAIIRVLYSFCVEQYYLLYWAAENSVTSVPSSTVTLEGTPCLGAYCNVKGYDGVIAAIGK